MICAYPTVKYVSIQDTRLVVLRYVLLLVIVSYVGVFEMWWMGGWLEPSPVVGVVRFSLQQPTVGNCDPVLPNCDNDFSPLHELEYCEQSNNDNNNNDTTITTVISNADYPGNRYPCEIYEAINAQVISEKSLTVITRASTVRQQFVCPSSIDSNNNTNTTCTKTYQNTSSEYKFYTAESERFTVLLDHAVTASKICARHQGLTTKDKAPPYACSAEASNPAYIGRLYSKNDALCQQEHAIHNAFQGYRGSAEAAGAPCYISPNRTKSSHQDFFSLGVLLQAAGVSLDDCNSHGSQESSARDDRSNDNNNNNNGSCQTYRDSGATLLLNIYWSDFVPYHGLVEPHYYYAPELLGRSSFKQYVPFYDNNYRESRTLLNAHGIRVAVLLGGEFNQFNIVTFLVTLTTALGLLAVATTIVDSLMIYVMPERERYQEAKYENTEAFEANDVVTSTVAGLAQLLVNNAAPSDAGRTDEATSPHHVGADSEALSAVSDGNGDGNLTDPLLGAET